MYGRAKTSYVVDSGWYVVDSGWYVVWTIAAVVFSPLWAFEAHNMSNFTWLVVQTDNTCMTATCTVATTSTTTETT